MAPGRGAGLPEGKAGSFAETNGAAAGIGGLPAWGHCRVPKAPEESISYQNNPSNITNKHTEWGPSPRTFINTEVAPIRVMKSVQEQSADMQPDA